MMKTIAVMVALAMLAPRAEAKGCHEISDVVGYEKCSRFGTWSPDLSYPRASFDVGYLHRSFASQPFVLGGPGSPLVVTEPTDLDTGGSMPGWFRVRIHVDDLFYVGADFGAGWLSQVPVSGAPVTDSVIGTAHALVGARFLDTRLVSLGVELAGGGRIVGLDSCDAKTMACASDTSVLQTHRELELRAVADIWLAPRFTLDIGYGRSVIDRGDSSLMISLGFHFRAMDGVH
jgi:hypothetical protein